MTRMRFETVCHGHFGALDPPKNWPQGATQLVKQKMTETETRQTEHKLIWCEKLLYGEDKNGVRPPYHALYDVTLS